MSVTKAARHSLSLRVVVVVVVVVVVREGDRDLYASVREWSVCARGGGGVLTHTFPLPPPTIAFGL